MIKILIVEDELIIAEDIKSILQKQGYHVIGIAMDYNEALRILNQKEKPTFLIIPNCFIYRYVFRL